MTNEEKIDKIISLMYGERIYYNNMIWTLWGRRGDKFFLGLGDEKIPECFKYTHCEALISLEQFSKCKIPKETTKFTLFDIKQIYPDLEKLDIILK